MRFVRAYVPLALFVVAIFALVAPAPPALEGQLRDFGAPTGSAPGEWIWDAPGNRNPAVVPPHALPLGHSYADWGVRWWRWALSFPARSNPIFDPTGGFNQQGQSPGVFFLAGGAGGSVERTVTIPKGTMIFFPIITADVTFPCPDPSFVPGPGQTLEDFLQSVGDYFMSLVGPMAVELDGQPLTDLASYRARSRLATITSDPSLAAALDACITGSEQSFVSDGFWIMLHQLKPGPHTLHFAAGIPASGVSFDVTYHIHVADGVAVHAAVAHATGLQTPEIPESWGRMKAIYR